MTGFAEKYGPWALVAGASEGTGQEYARKLARLGLPSVLIARRAPALAKLAGEIFDETGIQCATAAIDLGLPDAFDRVVEAVGDREIGLYIANAGSDPHGTYFLDVELQAWVELVHRNCVTTVQCSHHFGTAMRARKKGGIILMNSYACYGGSSRLAIYTASKAFELCFGEGLWTELKPFGVDVLNLVMGQTDTPEYRRFLTAKSMPLPAEGEWATAEGVAELGLSQLPHGPICNFGQANDVAGPMAVTSADERKARILAIDAYTDQLFGDR